MNYRNTVICVPCPIDSSCLLLDYPSKLSTSEHQSKSVSSTDHRSLPLYSLQHEFSLLNTNIPHIDVEVLDAMKRHAMIRVTANGHVIMLQVAFPENYPSPDGLPDFIYCQGTTIDDNLAESLVKVLKVTASHRIKRGRTCLEQCLRALVSSLKKVFESSNFKLVIRTLFTCIPFLPAQKNMLQMKNGSDKSYLRLQSPRLEGALSGALHDACVPFPRTSGARFSGRILVTFIQPLNTKGISFRHHNTTPR